MLDWMCMKNPIQDHDYVMTVDVARGVGEDYSAFVVVDITEFPHKIVAKYRNNDIKPMLFPNIIYEIAKIIIVHISYAKLMILVIRLQVFYNMILSIKIFSCVP